MNNKAPILLFLLFLGFNAILFSQDSSRLRVSKYPSFIPGKDSVRDTITQTYEVDQRGWFQNGWVEKNYPNGNLYQREYVHKGHRTGTREGFYPDGSVWYRIYAADSSSVVDSVIGYYADGKIRYRILGEIPEPLKRPEGTAGKKPERTISFVECEEDGEESFVHEFPDKRMGTLIQYYPDGKVKREIWSGGGGMRNYEVHMEIIPDQQTGQWGNVHATEFEGAIHYIERKYFPDGSMHSWCDITKGENYTGILNSTYMKWDSAGTLRLEGFSTEKPDSLGNRGYFKSYYANGKLKWKGEYPSMNGFPFYDDWQQETVPVNITWHYPRYHLWCFDENGKLLWEDNRR